MSLTRAPKAAAATPIPLPPPPRRTPVVLASTGLVQREWATWLDLLWKRNGEAHAPSNAELDDGLTGTQGDLEGTQDELDQVASDLGETQTTVAGLEAELTTLQGTVLQVQTDLTALTTRVTTLEGKVTALETASAAQETRLAALEAWKTAVVAALPAVVIVTSVPTLTDAPATADALRDNLTSGWQSPLNTNDAALASTVNAVRNALAA